MLIQMVAGWAALPVTWQAAQTAEAAIAYLLRVEPGTGRPHARRPDLVLLTLKLQGRMEGLSVLQFIRLCPGIKRLPVVIWTDFADPALREQAFTLGANDFCRKPLGLAELEAFLRSLYERWRGGSSAGD